MELAVNHPCAQNRSCSPIRNSRSSIPPRRVRPAAVGQSCARAIAAVETAPRSRAGRNGIAGLASPFRSRSFESFMIFPMTARSSSNYKLLSPSSFATLGSSRYSANATSTPRPRPSQSSGTSNRGPQCASRGFPSSRSSTSSATLSSHVACSSTTGAAGLGAPVRVCVAQRDGEEPRIDMERPSALFSSFPEMQPSSVRPLYGTRSW
jgi:hypothetical protein